MTVTGVNGLGRQAFSHPATQVCITTSAGDVIAFAVEMNGAIVVTHTEDPEFSDLLAAFRIKPPTIRHVELEE